MKNTKLVGLVILVLSGHWAVAQPSIINFTPTNLLVGVSAIATFSVTASGAAPLTYQWWFTKAVGESPIDGITNPSALRNILNLTNVQVSAAGGYYVVVTDANSLSATSRVATLTVDPTFVKIPNVSGGIDMWMPYWVDFDGNGWLELVVAGGYYTSGGKPLLVYENNRDGTLSRSLTHDLSKVSGRFGVLAWADLDNDGDLDCFAGTWEAAPPVYLRNQGGGRFAKVPADRWWTANGATVAGSTPACADFDNDGILDLVVGYLGNYATGGWGTNTVLHGLGDGRFEVDRTSALAISHTWVDGWGWADWDADGDMDLLGATSDDQNPSQMAKDIMFQNLGGGQFLRITNSPLVDFADFSFVPAWGDYDNDRDLDLCVPSENHTIQLYRNLGNGVFEPDAASLSFPASQTRRVGVWGDYDNDGWLDLYMTHRDQSSRLFHNRGDGTFEEMTTSSVVSECQGFGGAWSDYDNDGFLDLCAVNGNTGAGYLYRNNLRQAGNTNNWLKVKPVGTASNRGGIGATIRLKATVGGKELWQMRQIVCQSYQAELIAHFGLGDATQVDLLRIEWPSGNVQELSNVAANHLISITEGVGGLIPTRPSTSLNGSVALTRTLSIPGTYQWQFNGVDIAGQTNRTLNLTNIMANQEGRYSLVVSNATTITTNFVYLLVDPTFTKITTGAPVTDVANTWGGSWGDYEGDGYSDLFLARNKIGSTALYHNNGDDSFTSVADVPFAGTAIAASGALADFDNDGWQDLLLGVSGGGNSFCYFNNGDGTFSSNQSLSVSPWSIAVADYNRDGLLDLFTPKYAEPGNLYRNNGDRAFIRMTSEEAGALVIATTYGGAAWGDYDDDGWLELYSANVGASPPHIFHNNGTGRFITVTNLVTRTAPSSAIAGAWGDYDNDDKLDLCVAAYSSASVVYRNLGNGEFEKAAIGPTPGSAWSAAWVDYDNDGFLDLFFAGLNALYHNNSDGTFTRVTTGSLVSDVPVADGISYCGLWFDYDNDGFLDLYVINGNDAGDARTANFLYHNNGNNNAWLKVRLIGTASNRDGVGAKVRALATYAGQSHWQRRDITGGDAFNGNQLYAHFGLRNAAKVTTLRIEWPSGTVQELANVATNQFLTLWEPPAISAAVRADGACELNIKAEPNLGWQIQASGDLLTWQTLTTITNTTVGFQFTDTAAASMDCRFYRLRSQ